MKNDPEYKAKKDKDSADNAAHWEAYAKARAAGDPSIVSKDGWTGD